MIGKLRHIIILSAGHDYFLKEAAPIGFLQVTSAADALSKASKTANAVFSSKAVDYSAVSSDETVEWLKKCGTSKIVILDFGSRSNTLSDLLDLLKNTEPLGAKVTILAIGGPQKVLSATEAAASKKAKADLAQIPVNTSGIQDTAMETLGVGDFFQVINVSWEKLLEDRHKWAPDLNIVWGRGVSGRNGIGAGWNRLCKGNVGAKEALVYRLQRVDT
ncbi:hypothetical protein N7454_003988 [Penicillium verhagenii]|nr:hypothetical protein N7454_003988 [Penicillium verhagenii]